MNVFVLHDDPIKSAQMNCDKHVVKIPTEVTQVLSIAVISLGGVGPYGLTHMGHPLVKWAMRSHNHRELLYHMGIALCDEYEFRYVRVHKCKQLLIDMDLIPYSGIEINEPIPQSMPETYRKIGNVVGAYRDYYINEKAHLLKYTKRAPPDWAPEGVCQFKELSRRELKQRNQHAMQ